MTAIRLLRVRTGQTMRAFAQAHDLNEQTLCAIERGQMYVPPAMRQVLPQALNVPAKRLFDPETGWPKIVPPPHSISRVSLAV